ncbi:catenin alpha-3 [Cricetulus griseus]|nr:catenin alpha-3 [Cricetulus griseus]
MNGIRKKPYPKLIPEFVTQVNIALDALSKNSLTVFDDNQFVDISKKIYDTIHDIRCSVMMIRIKQTTSVYLQTLHSYPGALIIGFLGYSDLPCSQDVVFTFQGIRNHLINRNVEKPYSHVTVI